MEVSPIANDSAAIQLNDQWAIDIPSKHCCIYKVPTKLRKINEEAYTPQVVAIGPFHYKTDKNEKKEPAYPKKYEQMEKQKKRYLDFFCNRTGAKKEDITTFIRSRKQKIRHCYSEEFGMIKDEEFVEMVKLDAIFIIELFWRSHKWTRKLSNEGYPNPEIPYHLSVNPCRKNITKEDLMLLENQLPYFILEGLYSDFVYKVLEERGYDVPTFLQLTCEFFFEDPKIPDAVKQRGKGIAHFTDLLRTYYCHEMPPIGELETMYNATALSEAGLKFNRSKHEKPYVQFHHPEILGRLPCLNCSAISACLPCFKCVPYLELMQPRLELSHFLVEIGTEVLYRNLMALEQCHYPFETRICNYIRLLDNLIVSGKDVDLLVDRKVIANGLGGSEAASKLINTLCDQIVPYDQSDKDSGDGLSKKLNDYYENPWNRTMATMTNTYFSNFWRGTATIVGIIILLFAFWNFLRPFVM
ncbi:hypothetical protein CJ030_MR1G025750 [Morella rubra]|uniref:Uncharacterized protein n=1 Tax=Morella rubra TaxID=262757 RepID=A0A6A1WN08_9ROSI|nr:hypothetical protein CJ030_MR1G025750 [Morella rubra]